MKPNPVVFDFSQIADRVFIINGYKINFDKNMSYSKSLIVIDEVLNKKMKTSLWKEISLSSAYAEMGVWDTIKSYFAAATSQGIVSTLEYIKDETDVANRIITAYNSTPKEYKSVFPRFTCENKRILKIESQNTEAPVASWRFKRDERTNTWKGQYFFLDANKNKEYKCNITANEAGNIISNAGSEVEKNSSSNKLCGKINENIFNIQYTNDTEEKYPLLFGEYPLIADQCCREEGCYEKVTAEVQPYKKQSQNNSQEASGTQ